MKPSMLIQLCLTGPRAIALGHLGQDVQNTVPNIAREERSLSAYVWGFDAKCNGPDLVHHNVFFADTQIPNFGILHWVKCQTIQRFMSAHKIEGNPMHHPRLKILN